MVAGRGRKRQTSGACRRVPRRRVTDRVRDNGTMPRLDRIYTKTGDEGMTGLGGGQRVAKDSLAGRDLRHGRRAQLADRRRARDRACASASRPSSPPSRTSCSTSGRTSPRRRPARPATRSRPSRQRHIETLERLIDEFNEVVGPLTNFLLPGGSPGAAQLHVARTVCRRAERERHDARPRGGDRPDRAPLPQPPVRRAVRDGALREPRARRRRAALAARRLTASEPQRPAVRPGRP